ncbi:hypothetical protein SELMODRAFT_139792 [Selaginella moellendorffii]|uniref:Granulins domain-containing protein n=1 Tax=Selaginella moellendorffii TaxID=88036 RepID=D8QMM0_SELML|nr:ervatamin-B [Selaginella moellendorffii]EFJ38599.1 hypothetical protein SELMODRAFT_139792 [Selaginella moellendorffii]|eukprot:XP_002961060.1 ervatamin-B [Selaginella moellendorffii]
MASLRSLVVFVSLVVAFGLAAAHGGHLDFSPADLESEDRITALFDAWCEEHGKRYGTEDERLLRREVFKEKLFQIQAHNSQQHSYQLGLNQFSDQSQEEMEARLPRVDVKDLMKKWGSVKEEVSSVAAPASIDWRRKGAVVARVKDIGSSCKGASWTYAATGAVEGRLAIDGNRLQDLSAQQLLDCVDEANKCTTLDPVFALDYVAENGLTTEKLYPYTGTIGQCKPLPSSLVTISGVERIYSSSDDTELLNAVAKQPVAVIVDGTTPQFINYRSGIYTGPFADAVTTTSLLVVGYDTLNGVPYWIAKNSWGYGWGEGGYIRIKRQGGEPYGILNINAFPSYPTGAAPGSKPPPCGGSQSCPSAMTCCCIEPAIGSKCSQYMCCPSKYSDCQGGCCKQKKSFSVDEMVFTTKNQTSSY